MCESMFPWQRKPCTSLTREVNPSVVCVDEAADKAAALTFNIFKEITDHAKLISQSGRTAPILTKRNVRYDVTNEAVT